MASNYDANIRIAVQGQNQIDAAANSINRLQKLIDQVSRGVVLTGADPRRLSAGWDAVANSIGKASRELQQFAQIANRLTQTPQRALPPGRQGGPLAGGGGLPPGGTGGGGGGRRALPPAGELSAQARVIRVQVRDLTNDIADVREVMEYWAEGLNRALPAGVGRTPSPYRRGQRAAAMGAQFPLDGPLGNPFNPPTRLFRSPRFSGNLRSAASSAAIGGGFPLLFGQGAGASIGGFVGGGLGGALGGAGGFAGGIVGSLLGTQFDKVKANALGLADALKAPSEALAAMEAAGIKVGGALKNTVDALENTGRAAEAQALVFAELERLGGSDYVQNLLELEEANKELQASWSKMSVVIMDEMLPAVILLTRAAKGFADFIANSDIITRWAGLVQASPGGAGVGLIGRLLQGQGLGEAAANTGAQVQGGVNQLLTGQKPPETRNRQPQPVDDTRQRKALDEAIARQKEAEDLRRRGIQLELSQIDARFDREEAIYNFRKRASDYEREVAEFRRDLEDKIFAKQQENARTLADLARQRRQNEIERFDQTLQPLGAISALEGGGRAAGVDLVREYIRARAEGEADLQQKETETQLKIQEIRREGDKFRLDVAKKVYEFQQKAEQFARDVTKYEWEQQKKIYNLQIEAADYQYAMWENAYKRATEINQMMREAAANPLGDVTPGLGAVATTGPIRNLLSLIYAGEGGYNSYNRGVAGDSPGGFPGGLTNKTIGQVMDLQAAGRAFAVGAAQFIPSTLKIALRDSGLSKNDLFSGPNQDKLAAALLTGTKRPTLANYLKGLNSDIIGAQRDLALEWASVVGPNGKGMYDGDSAGNRASGSVARTQAALREARAGLLAGTPTRIAAAREGATPAAGGATPVAPVALTRPVPLPARRAGGVGPAFLPQLPGAPDVSRLERSYLNLNEQQVQLLEGLQAEARERTRIADLAAQARLDEGIAAIGQQYLQPMIDARQAAEDRFKTEQQYSDLLQAGVLPALAEQLSQADELERTQLRLLDTQIKIAEATALELQSRIEINRALTTRTEADNTRLTDLLAAWRANQKVLAGLGDARAGVIGQGDQLQAQLIQNESPEARRQRTLDEYNRRKNEREDVNRPFDQYMKAKADLEDLIDPLNQVMSATDALGNAFGDAFRSIIDGSESADQALKKMFANIGSYFLNMATQILAQQAMTSILGLFAGGASAATGGGGNGFLTGGLFNTQFSYAGGGYTGDGARSGGIDGQGGFPAILHPQETVIDHTMPRPALRPAGDYGLGEAQTPEITYSGAVLNFNGNEYVSKADVPKIIAASTAATGAKMRSSVSYRKRAGI